MQAVAARGPEEESGRSEGIKVIVWFGEEAGAEGQEGFGVGGGGGSRLCLPG